MKIEVCNNSEGFFYRANKFDTIDTICEKLSITKSYFLKYNKLNNDKVSYGDLYYFPSDNIICHIVSPLDTLSKIAEMYNVSEKEILENNNIDILFIGQKLYIKK